MRMRRDGRLTEERALRRGAPGDKVVLSSVRLPLPRRAQVNRDARLVRRRSGAISQRYERFNSSRIGSTTSSSM